MDKRTQRTAKKREHIQKVALDLFSSHGFDKVSMDEIAEQANVSKVTIYKYFGSKDDLYMDVIKLFIDETFSAAEKILNSDIAYLDKLKHILMLQTDSSTLVSFDTLYHQVWEAEGTIGRDMLESIQNQVSNVMLRFYEEGKQKGFIEDGVTFETMLLHAEVFRAGIKATFIDPNIPIDKQVLEQLYDVFFFGMLKRK